MLLLQRAVRRLFRPTRPPARHGRRAPARTPHATAARAVGVLLVGIVTLAGALTSVVTSAGPASAHASLVKATPADGAVLGRAPTSVTLQFDDPISTSFATLAVTGPDGSTVSTGRAKVSGATVSVALDKNPPSGRYRTVFRVVSEDGHPVNGQLTFTLKLPGSATAPATASAPPPATASGRSSGTSATGAASPSDDAGASAIPGDSAAGGSSWLARNLLPLTGALLLVVIGVGALLWDRLRH